MYSRKKEILNKNTNIVSFMFFCYIHCRLLSIVGVDHHKAHNLGAHKNDVHYQSEYDSRAQ